jgi:hypothetical protein
MKKTLRLIALTGIIATCWLSSERPSHAIQYCSALDGTPCSNPSWTRLCITDYPGEEGTCSCVTSHWSCVY